MNSREDQPRDPFNSPPDPPLRPEPGQWPKRTQTPAIDQRIRQAQPPNHQQTDRQPTERPIAERHHESFRAEELEPDRWSSSEPGHDTPSHQEKLASDGSHRARPVGWYPPATKTNLASEIAKSWNRFWFEPIGSSFNFALLRTGLGSIAFVWFATFASDLTAFFGSEGLDPGPFNQPLRFGIFRLLEADIFLWIGLAVGLGASALLVLGRYAKVAGPVLAVMVASFMAENQFIWNAGDEVLRTFTLFFAVFCLLTPASVLDVRLSRLSKLNKPMPEGRIWLFRLIQIQITIIYIVTFLAKIPGETWRDGTATMIMFRLDSMERFYVPGFLESNLLLGNLITWTALVLEGTLPFLLWNRRARPYAVAAGILFHLSIAWSISIGIFSWVMILGYIPFFSPTFLPSASGAVKRLRQRY